jgi:aminoglycoside 3-N-acetyltransferase I
MRSHKDITCHLLHPEDIADFVELVRLFGEVFEWEMPHLPGLAHLHKVLRNPSFLVLVAKAGGRVLGGLTVHVLERYDCEKASAYIYDVAVDTAWQGQGIGQRLIAEIAAICKAKGYEDMFVQAETGDVDAVRFYRKTALSEELPAIQFTYALD